MRKIALLLAGSSMLMLSGCILGPYSPGYLYSDVTFPTSIHDNGAGNCGKKGTSQALNVLGLVGMGNAGVEAAKKEGGINVVSNVDVKYNNVLGIFATTTTQVCGN